VQLSIRSKLSFVHRQAGSFVPHRAWNAQRAQSGRAINPHVVRPKERLGTEISRDVHTAKQDVDPKLSKVSSHANETAVPEEQKACAIAYILLFRLNFRMNSGVSQAAPHFLPEHAVEV
jgi:hypothetical protein